MAMLMAMGSVYGWTKSQEGFSGGATASFQCPFLFIARCNPPPNSPSHFISHSREMLGAWDLGGPPSTPPALARTYTHAMRDATQLHMLAQADTTLITPIGD